MIVILRYIDHEADRPRPPQQSPVGYILNGPPLPTDHAHQGNGEPCSTCGEQEFVQPSILRARA